jgi:hypothetical protein
MAFEAPAGTEFDKRWVAMGLYWTSGHSPYASEPDPRTPGKRDPDADDAPETPPDEPRPPRVQDPPPQPDQKGPYVVQASKFSN